MPLKPATAHGRSLATVGSRWTVGSRGLRQAMIVGRWFLACAWWYHVLLHCLASPSLSDLIPRCDVVYPMHSVDQLFNWLRPVPPGLSSSVFADRLTFWNTLTLGLLLIQGGQLVTLGYCFCTVCCYAVLLTPGTQLPWWQSPSKASLMTVHWVTVWLCTR